MELIVRAGQQTGQHLAGIAGKSEWTLGRSNDNDIVLADSLASRHHATIQFQLAGVQGPQLLDNQSANGITVNGQRVAGSIVLNNGDRIQIGQTVMEVAGIPVSSQSPTLLDVPPAEATETAIPLPGVPAAGYSPIREEEAATQYVPQKPTAAPAYNYQTSSPAPNY